MHNIRKAIREAARWALDESSRFTGFEHLPSWEETINSDALPVRGAFILAENFARTTLGGEHQRDIKLTIVAKRQGGRDIDDELDEDLEQIVGLISQALNGAVICAANVQCTAEAGQTQISADGGKRVGTVAVTFNCRCYWIF
ncbi:hypothetical protein [Ketogulonicigenium vulgare]|uniref:hypothetical protein n=1 Tax=Ketogulonicigenium vulgare TaxID=92945 RepID=UPI0023584F3C|nr:hypothetical protein [Ketogulonicigenium vulgare]